MWSMIFILQAGLGLVGDTAAIGSNTPMGTVSIAHAAVIRPMDSPGWEHHLLDVTIVNHADSARWYLFPLKQPDAEPRDGEWPTTLQGRPTPLTAAGAIAYEYDRGGRSVIVHYPEAFNAVCVPAGGVVTVHRLPVDRRMSNRTSDRFVVVEARDLISSPFSNAGLASCWRQCHSEENLVSSAGASIEFPASPGAAWGAVGNGCRGWFTIPRPRGKKFCVKAVGAVPVAEFMLPTLAPGR